MSEEKTEVSDTIKEIVKDTVNIEKEEINPIQ